jgi:hypothetical protein
MAPTLNENDTPRTDAAQYHPFDNQGGDHADWVVDADVARQLERENSRLLFALRYIMAQTHVPHIHDTASAAIAPLREGNK